MVSNMKSSVNKLNTLKAAHSMCETLTVQLKYGQRIGMSMVTLGKF